MITRTWSIAFRSATCLRGRRNRDVSRDGRYRQEDLLMDCMWGVRDDIIWAWV